MRAAANARNGCAGYVLDPPVGGVSTWGGEALLADASLGGEGCPQVAAYAPEPLAITLGAAYRYRLEGREIVDGQDCYVVAFQPMDASRHLLRGRAWIAARGFAMVRDEAVQAGLRGPIVSSQQRDVFSAVRL